MINHDFNYIFSIIFRCDTLAKFLFPNVLSVLVIHFLSKISSRSNSFLSLTKFIISSLNSSLFPYSLVKNFPPFLFKVPSSSFIYSSCIVFRRLGFAHVSLLAKLLRRLGFTHVSLSSKLLGLPRTSFVRRSNSSPYLTLLHIQH